MLCLAIALHTEAYSNNTKAAVDKILTRRKHRPLRSACLFARAKLTKDEELEDLEPWFRSLDPISAAIAAWRVGRTKSIRSKNWQDLFTLVLGAPGIARKAALAAIYMQLQKSDAPSLPPFLPHLEQNDWPSEVQRWLMAVIAPRHPPLRNEHFQAHCREWRQALAMAKSGSQNQRYWALQQYRQRSTHESGSSNRNVSAFCQP